MRTSSSCSSSSSSRWASAASVTAAASVHRAGSRARALRLERARVLDRERGAVGGQLEQVASSSVNSRGVSVPTWTTPITSPLDEQRHAEQRLDALLAQDRVEDVGVVDVGEDDRPALGRDPAGEAAAERDPDALLDLLLDPSRRAGDELVRRLVEQQERARVAVERSSRIRSSSSSSRSPSDEVRERRVGDGLDRRSWSVERSSVPSEMPSSEAARKVVAHPARCHAPSPSPASSTASVSPSARIERSSIGSTTRIASSAPASASSRSCLRDPLRRALDGGARRRAGARRAGDRAGRGRRRCARSSGPRPACSARVIARSARRSPRACCRSRRTRCSRRRRAATRSEHARPVAPIISGGRRAGRGSRTASSTRWTARERHALAVQQPADDLERLLEARDAVVERDPERAELRLVPARAERQHEAAAADLVEGRRHLARSGPAGGSAVQATSGPIVTRSVAAARPPASSSSPTARARGGRRRGRAGGRRARSSRSRPPRPRAPSRGTRASAPRARPPAAGSRRGAERGTSGVSPRRVEACATTPTCSSCWTRPRGSRASTSARSSAAPCGRRPPSRSCAPRSAGRCRTIRSRPLEVVRAARRGRGAGRRRHPRAAATSAS